MTIDILPQSLNQMTQIAKVSDVPEVRRAVWSETQKETGRDQPTPKEIKTTAVAVVRRSLSEMVTSATPKKEPKPETLVIDGLIEGVARIFARCGKLFEELHEAADAKAKASPREMASITNNLKAKIDAVKKPLPGMIAELEKLVGSWKNYRKQVDDL